MNGFIYMLRNEAMPDLYKIGMTERDDVEERVRELSRSTSVPFSFDVEFAFKINCSNFANIKEFENWLHDSLGDKRVNPKREFFRVNPEMVRKIIHPFVEKEEIIIEVEIDTEDKASKEKAIRARPPFNFDMIGLKIGNILNFTLDNNIKAVVTDNKKIRLLDDNGMAVGELFSTSGLANKLLEEKFNRPQKATQGTLFWEYNGYLLNDLRNAKEDED